MNSDIGKPTSPSKRNRTVRHETDMKKVLGHVSQTTMTSSSPQPARTKPSSPSPTIRNELVWRPKVTLALLAARTSRRQATAHPASPITEDRVVTVKEDDRHNAKVADGNNAGNSDDKVTPAASVSRRKSGTRTSTRDATCRHELQSEVPRDFRGLDYFVPWTTPWYLRLWVREARRTIQQRAIMPIIRGRDTDCPSSIEFMSQTTAAFYPIGVSLQRE